MAKIYIAAAFQHGSDARILKREIEETSNHTVVSNWHSRDPAFNDSEMEFNAAAAQSVSFKDLTELEECDWLVVLVYKEEPSRGGKHWETGDATKAGKKIILIPIHSLGGDQREIVFHYLPETMIFNDSSDFLNSPFFKFYGDPVNES